MFFRSVPLVKIAFLILLANGCSTSIRVYRPYASETPFEVIKTFPKVSVITPDSPSNRFAYYSPFLYTSKSVPLLDVEYDLMNEYGSLSYLVRKELSIRPDNYPLFLSEGGKIDFKEFVLESIDNCYINEVSVKIKAEIQIGRRKVEFFEYSDQIRSHVTDCIISASAITIIPLIWYVPYNGYRGNREDQLNQLGRNSMEAFFSFLETQSGYLKKTSIETKKSQAPAVDPVRDPKIKEIMDNL